MNTVISLRTVVCGELSPYRLLSLGLTLAGNTAPEGAHDDPHPQPHP